MPYKNPEDARRAHKKWSRKNKARVKANNKKRQQWALDRKAAGEKAKSRGKKICSRCGVKQKLTAFSYDYRAVDCHHAICRACDNEHHIQDRKLHQTPTPRAVRTRFSRLKDSAKQRGISINLTLKEFKKFAQAVNYCAYCLSPIHWNSYTRGYFLDRRDSKLGYSIDNIVPCCPDCNLTKNNKFTHDEFLLIADAIRLVKQNRVAGTPENYPFIHTSSGKLIHIGMPQLDQIYIEDIAKSLSQMCRFGSHTRIFYSVGEHSCRVSDLCGPPNKLIALLHEAGEALGIGDLPRPYKYSPGMMAARFYEDQIKKAVYTKFGLPLEEPPELKRADNILLVTEQRDLMPVTRCAGNVRKEELKEIEPLSRKIKPWSPERARKEFLKRFRKLTK